MTDWSGAVCVTYGPRWEMERSLSQQRGDCGRCPLRTDCLTFALSAESPTDAAYSDTMYGGLTGVERAELLTKSKRKPLQPCGTRAAYVRHMRRGEDSCGPCLEANRADSHQRLENAR